MTKAIQPARDFAALRRRLAHLQRRYNAAGKNLHFHFEELSFGDADLYPCILSLAEDGLRTLERHRRHFAAHALYDDGMFWYNLFLMIRAAAARVRLDRAEAYIDEKLVDKLLHFLTKMSRSL